MADRDRADNRIEDGSDDRAARRRRGEEERDRAESEGPSHLGEAEHAFEESRGEERRREKKRD